jgi:hypothetical protein
VSNKSHKLIFGGTYQILFDHFCFNSAFAIRISPSDFDIRIWFSCMKIESCSIFEFKVAFFQKTVNLQCQLQANFLLWLHLLWVCIVLSVQRGILPLRSFGNKQKDLKTEANKTKNPKHFEVPMQKQRKHDFLFFTLNFHCCWICTQLWLFQYEAITFKEIKSR